jgi:tRNA G18 (ribose-2'-O)-methylase SpoU
MGSLFARPPARASFEELPGTLIGLDTHAERQLGEVEAAPPVVVCLGAERSGLPEGLPASARIPLRPDGPDSLNVAMAATVALYDLGNRMARDG